jgi:cyanobactin maturation PatA/PatG family protease
VLDFSNEVSSLELLVEHSGKTDFSEGQYTNISSLSGLLPLWSQTSGSSDICVAILDGFVDFSHPCFHGSQLELLPTLVEESQEIGAMSIHGTHVASLIFGQNHGVFQGIAPKCRGLIIPVFSNDKARKLSQLDLARAINQAVEHGAHIINISGGELSESGEADAFLVNAIQSCQDNNVLIIAAAGNNGCECLHVPAALPSVLSVGAMDANGMPLDFSNWGESYQRQGIMAPGANILGAAPGGSFVTKSGTSYATPIVSGIAALLLSLQIQRGDKPNPHEVRDALLRSALSCDSTKIPEGRCLAGRLNILGAKSLITQTGERENMSESELKFEASGTSHLELPKQGSGKMNESGINTELSSVSLMGISSPIETLGKEPIVPTLITASGIEASEDCGCNSSSKKSLVYALGTLSYDFGTEARRDSFRQLMPFGAQGQPSNPYDPVQMFDYLTEEPAEATQLIWVINIELTPVYAIEPEGAYAQDVYRFLVDTVNGQIQPEDNPDFVSRIAIPGVLTGKNVRLITGQVIPVIKPLNRGLASWNIVRLLEGIFDQLQLSPETRNLLQGSITDFLSRIYYDLRNLGQTSAERALNYAATNIFNATSLWVGLISNAGQNPPTTTGLVREVTEAGQPSTSILSLASIEVHKSPFCRMDSDCWDIVFKFFDPENVLRAKKVYRFTIDVSDELPVQIGQVRGWSVAY